jgi:hypothetical protein
MHKRRRMRQTFGRGRKMTMRLLNTKDAAKILGLAPQTLAIMRLRGSPLRHVKLGRRVLYDPADVFEFIRASKKSSTSETARHGRST